MTTTPPPPADPVEIEIAPEVGATQSHVFPVSVGDDDRIASLDVIRGIAICGILLVNIESFSMVREARYDTNAGGGEGGINYVIWLATFLFADTKFIAIFTMLFGAGIAAFYERWRQRGARGAWAVYYRRMLFLLVLGAAHGLLLWRGDILYFYAFWGLALYFAPRLPAWLLASAGLALYTWHARDFGAQLEGIDGGYSWWEQQVYEGGWSDQYAFRKQFEWYYLWDVPFQFAPHLVGLMLLGMASYKTGFLRGEGRVMAFTVVAAATIAAGTAMVVFSTELTAGFADETSARRFIWGSLLLSLGYIAASVVLTRVAGAWRIVRGLGALGRMALTNYLMQTVICTTIFYGYGFGMFGRVDRLGQAAIVLAIWTFQLVFSSMWMRVFRFGPCEWVWRTVSYLRPQPMLRRPALEGEAMVGRSDDGRLGTG